MSLKSLISEREKAFDKKLDDILFYHNSYLPKNPKDWKVFNKGAIKDITQQILSLIEELEGKMPKKIVQTFVNCSKHNLSDDFLDCKDCHWEHSPEETRIFNSAIDQMRASIKELKK
jgi:hypothetical protein